MGEWRKVRLGDCIKEINQRTMENNQYEVLTSSKSGIYSQNEYFDKQVASKDNTGYKIIKNGQFTYRSMSDNGTFTINRLENKEIGIVSPAYPVFEAISINAEYLKYFFQSDEFRKAIYTLSQGSTRTALKYKDLSEIEILLPSIKEQEKIVCILDNVKKIINLYNTKIKKLTDQKIYIIDKILNNENWKVTTIGDISEIATKQTGFDYSATIKPSLLTNSEKETLPYLQTKNFKGINFSYDTDYYIPQNIASMFPKINLNEKCILMSIVGASVGNIGYFNGEKKCFLGGAICKLKLKNLALTELIYYELESKLGQNQIKKLIKGGAQDTITIEDIRKMKIIVPEEETEIFKITNIFKKLDDQIIKCEKLMELHDRIKDGLMQKLLTGKVRVKI